MASNRIGRINEEIQRELADQLRRLKDPRVSQVGMVSITRLRLPAPGAGPRPPASLHPGASVHR